MGATNSANFFILHHFIQFFIPLYTHKKSKHIVTNKVKLVFINTSEYSIISQQTKKKCPFILIITILSPKWQRHIWAAIKLSMDTLVTI